MTTLRIGQKYYYYVVDSKSISAKVFLDDDMDKRLWDSKLAFYNVSEAVAYHEAMKSNENVNT